ncbi:MAG: PAS domain S-box protein, partial [Bacillota bacterium]
MIEQKNEMKAVKTLLKLFTKKYSKQEYLDIVVKCIQDWCGCRCVGIRFLTEEGYIPYESYVGFSEEFWESENWLSVKSDKCACIRVIAGNQEPQDAPVMTQGGSFFSNNAIKYFSELSEEQRARFRGVCVQSGYASIAIVPIMHKGKTIGAIYLADEHKGKVPVQVVEFIESITPLIGEAINTCDLKEELQVSCDIQLVLDNLLDGISEIVYVADPKTYEILYVNQTTRNLFQKDPVGGTCYREFQGRESPCEFCTNEIILKEKGKPYQWEYHNPLLNKDFMLVDKVIKWTDGRDVRFEFAVDITGLKTAEKAVRSRLEFEKTVKRISSRFVGVYDLDDAINASLADMGKLSRASRAYLFCFRQDGAKMDNTHEWCAESVSPQIGNLQNLSSDTVPWWMAKLSRGEVIHIQDVSKMPPEANAEKEILESQDIKSLLVLPLYVKGKLYGFIGFDNIRETGMWSNDALTLLRLFSEIIGNAFDRQRMEEALRESEDSYRTIFENTGTATVIIEKDTVISLVNAEFERLLGYSKEEVEGKKSWTEFVAKENLEKMKESHYLPRSNPQATPRCYEGQFMDRQGNIKDVIVTVAMLPGTKKSVASLLDITERKRAEEQLEYLSFHDPLTGLYNRTYFEKEMSRFENRPDSAVSIIICDVDGL